MNFRSVSQLSDQVLSWSKELPRDIEVIVGIARSGLLVANLLSTYTNLPFTDVHGLLDNRCFPWGRTSQGTLASRFAGGADGVLASPRKVLLVDDSLLSGGTLDRVRAEVASGDVAHEVQTGVVYVAPGRTEEVDHYVEVLDGPRIFEWNLFRHGMLRESCVDLDGVLCANPEPYQDDDGETYRRFLQEARPLFRADREIGWIVTARLEKYRPETERWLARHDVAYHHLVMLDYSSDEQRRRLGIHSAFKADVYRRTGARLFIESSVRQAVEIAEYSGRSVICTDTMQLVRPGQRPITRSGHLRVYRTHPLKRAALAVLPDSVERYLRHRAMRRRLR